MPNIIDGINKMQKEQLCYQLATLKTVTMSNVFSEMGQKVSHTTVKVFNGLRSLFDVAPVKEPTIVPLDQRIANCNTTLSAKSQNELIEDMRKTLIEKVNSVGNSLRDDISDDALDVCVIEVACKKFKKSINSSLSPAQKADAIYQRYNENLISQTQEKYKKASNAEKADIDKQLQEGIDSLSDEQKEEMKKALQVDKVTGETLKKFLTTSAGASALLIALNASGFGAFMALTTIMHAVFTTTLGITLPFVAYTTSTSILSFLLGPAGWIIFAGAEIFMFNNNKNKLIYELMAQVVWSSVLECGGRFTPKDEILPSWLPKEQMDLAIADNKQFMELQNRFDSLQKDYDNQTKEIKKKEELQKKKEAEIVSLNEKITMQQKKIQNTTKQKEQVETELNRAKIEFNKYKEYANSENGLFRQKYAEAERNLKKAEQNVKEKQTEIESLQQSNNEAQDMINMYEEELSKVNVEKRELQEQNTKMQAELTEAQEKTVQAELKETKKLQKRWEVTYKKFEFDPGVIKNVVKKYEYNEYGYIERRLMELHEKNDPAALSSNRGKMAVSGELHLEVSTPTGYPSRIFYLPLKNTKDGKTVRITKICKHNDPRYGK